MNIPTRRQLLRDVRILHDDLAAARREAETARALLIAVLDPDSGSEARNQADAYLCAPLPWTKENPR